MASILLLAAFVMMLAVIMAIGFFVDWRKRTRQWLMNAGSIVETSAGPIECVIFGPKTAPPVLVLHGGLGGWDQAAALAEDLHLDRTFRVIAPSRPGYLRTPLSAGSTPKQAADAMIALLDALKIAKATVIGISGGGPTALAVSTEHPQRIRSLVMVCAISRHHVQPGMTKDSPFGRLLFSRAGDFVLDACCWTVLQLARAHPAYVTRRVLCMTELAGRATIRQRVEDLQKKPDQRRWIVRLFNHCFPISPRRIGLTNDLAQFAALPGRLEERIPCPTLVIHGGIDGNVSVAHAQAVIDATPGAESLIIDDASHLLWLHPDIDKVRTENRDICEVLVISTPVRDHPDEIIDVDRAVARQIGRALRRRCGAWPP